MKPMDRSERTALNVDMVPGTLNVYNFGGDITTNLTYFTFKQNLIGRSRFYSELTVLVNTSTGILAEYIYCACL